jgi:hypothetical protein
MHNLKQLRRLRWLVLVTVLAGIAASITMNVLHAPPNLAARFVATIPPLAVFGALELIARIPSSSPWLTRARVAGAASVAAGAAAISYAQQRAAVHELGFPMWEATIWPAIIDGFMVVASVSLVEVVRKIRDLTSPALPATSLARQRVLADQHETPGTLAYREAAAKLRRESSVASMNGNKPEPATVN